MRTLAIGDIHGCLRALDLLLEFVRPQPDDVIVTLGDYVDRGPDCRGVLDRLIALQRQCTLVPLKGNHDIMMMQARQGQASMDAWVECGGRATLQSYGVEPGWQTLEDALPAQHWRFLESCVAFHETETHFFVHANAHAESPLDDQPDYMLFWEKIDLASARPHENGKKMVCGHAAQKSGVPFDLGFAVCIDTWVYGDGWLTCLDVNTGQYWQANQKGKRDPRSDWLQNQ